MDKQIRSADLLVTMALADPQIIDDLKTNPESTLKRLGSDVVAQLPRLLPPDTPTTNWIWLIVVSAFALVMVGSALVLGLGVFEHSKDTNTITKSDTILTVFTTVVGFLAGLLSPTPFARQ